MRLYSLYGDASDSLIGSLETGELARSALIEAESTGAVPSLLCGDFNLTFAQLPCLHALVASNWSDLGGGYLCALPRGVPEDRPPDREPWRQGHGVREVS